jgi:hypothetical protein
MPNAQRYLVGRNDSVPKIHQRSLQNDLLLGLEEPLNNFGPGVENSGGVACLAGLSPFTVLPLPLFLVKKREKNGKHKFFPNRDKKTQIFPLSGQKKHKFFHIGTKNKNFSLSV